MPEVIYKLAAPLPGGDPTVSNFTDYAQFLFPFLLSVASILALVMFTLGAIQYMFSDGGEGNKDGKDKMTNAILGLLLAAGSVLLLETINPKLITLEIDIQQRNGAANPGPGPTPTNNPPEQCPTGTLCGGSCFGICPFGRTCENVGGTPQGSFECKSGQRCVPNCPPPGDTSLTICVPSATGGFGDCRAPNNIPNQDCTDAQKRSCPANVPCVIQTTIIYGRPIKTPICLVP